MASIDLIFDAPPAGPGSPVDLVFGATAPEAVLPGVHLVFRSPPFGPGPVHLVFGDDPDTPAPVIDPVTLQSTAQITGIAQHLRAAIGVGVQYSTQITGLARVLEARYDINISRATVAATNAVWQDSTTVKATTAVTYRQALPVPTRVAVEWQDAQALFAHKRVLQQDAQRLRNAISSAFEQAQRLPTAPLAVHWQSAQRLRHAIGSAFERAVRLPTAPLAVLFERAYTDRRAQVASRFQTAQRLARPTASGMGIAVRIAPGFDGAYQQAWPPRIGRTVVVPPVPPRPPSCYDPALPAHLVFRDAPFGPGPVHLVFACAPGTEPVDPEQPGETIVIPIRRVYIVINNITLHRVDTGAELHAHSFSMSLDHQSWTWSWQASLHADAAAHLGRDSQGDPAEVEAVVNGTPFRLRLVTIARDRRFSPTRWSVSGQGKAAILAEPWAPKLSFGNPSAARTAQQLANDALTINGVGIGWTVDWGITDWQVPEGAWALQGSYIEAINDIASSVGGYVQPHPTASVLRILPRYPAVPWAWGSITPDFEIPEDAAEIEGTQYVDRPAYDRVFVGGVGAGVFGPFTRAGTAGNNVAPQATHALITDAPAHRQRGIAALSDTGRQEHITLNMQVLPETGVIVPGQFVRYLSPTPKLGIVRSTSIDWSRPRLRQTIKIETHA